MNVYSVHAAPVAEHNDIVRKNDIEIIFTCFH